MIVDTHVHVLDFGQWPGAWWDYVAAGWAREEPGRRPEMVREKIESGLVDPEGDRMVADMDAAGVDVVCTLPIDWGPDFPAEVGPEEMVAHAVRCAHRHPGRILAFAGVDPRRAEAPALLERWITEDRVAGLKLYPPCGWEPDDPRAMALYEVCMAHDLPVLFHTGDPLPLLDGEFSRPARLKPVVEAFPDLRVWLGHAGAHSGWEEALAVAEASRAAKLELSVWVWGDSSHEDELRLARLVAEARDRIGIDRILFGTDHVSGAKERRPGFLAHVTGAFKRLPELGEEAGVRISPEEVEMVMGTNAARDLGLSS